MSQTPTSEHDAIASYRNFSFANDEGYQQGLNGIIASGALVGKSNEEQARILRLSRMFYFNRLTGQSISDEDARKVEEKNSVSVPDASKLQTGVREEDPPRTLTFTEIKELIEQGKTDNIPNNKLIPDILNEAPQSESNAPIRAKPWESPDGAKEANQN